MLRCHDRLVLTGVLGIVIIDSAAALNPAMCIEFIQAHAEIPGRVDAVAGKELDQEQGIEQAFVLHGDEERFQDLVDFDEFVDALIIGFRSALGVKTFQIGRAHV